VRLILSRMIELSTSADSPFARRSLGGSDSSDCWVLIVSFYCFLLLGLVPWYLRVEVHAPPPQPPPPPPHTQNPPPPPPPTPHPPPPPPPLVFVDCQGPPCSCESRPGPRWDRVFFAISKLRDPLREFPRVHPRCPSAVPARLR